MIVTPADDTTALPGLPGHPLLTAGSPVLTAARAALGSSRIQTVFLCPRDDSVGSLYRATALGCPTRRSARPTIVVLLSPPPDLHGLTRRELKVLGFLTEGWPNARIAVALTVAQRTVESHIEHIIAKLGASSRTMAAVCAQRQGMYLPAPVAEMSTASRGDR